MRFISSIYSTSKKPTAFSFLDVQKDNKFKTMVQQKDRWTIGQLSFLKLLRAKIDETLFCSKSKKKKCSGKFHPYKSKMEVSPKSSGAGWSISFFSLKRKKI